MSFKLQKCSLLHLPAYRRLLCLLLASALMACAQPKAKPADHAGHEVSEASAASASPEVDHADHAHQSVEAAEPTDQSLYQLESDWQTQTGKTIRLSALAGQPVVLAMVYASCKNACPRIIADMKQIQASRSQKQPQGTRFVLVSIDPEVDTPARLAELARKSQLGAPWLLLRGDSDELLELAALLGVRYRKISDKDYAHTNLITLLNAKGEIVHRQQGLGVDPTATIQALNALQPAR